VVVVWIVHIHIEISNLTIYTIVRLQKIDMYGVQLIRK